MKTACLIIIGNEVLSGRTQDANLAYLGDGLNQVGVRLMEARVIPDLTDVIVATVNTCRIEFDYVFTTGGIGPTHDDITSAAIAKAFGLPLVRHPEALALMKKYYENNQLELNEQRLKMTEMAEGATLVGNPVSVAPGYKIDNVYVMAGVPRIMQAMFDGMKHTLVGGKPMISRSILARLGEGSIAKGLGDIQDRHPNVEIGSYPFFRDGKLGTSLVMRSTSTDAITAAAAEIKTLIRDLGVEPVDE
ncbi:MAG TPA: competence/damage-inducible protein A [Rhodospirillales bacterium]|nr:competence/damage-inducible protein A [Rhodospirillales bacterium]